MSKTITITLPDGYDDTTYVVLVAPDHSDRTETRYVHVLRVQPDGTARSVEEVGGGALRPGLILAARVIREDEGR